MAADLSAPGQALGRHGQILEQQQLDQLREMQRRALREVPPPGGETEEISVPPADVPASEGGCRHGDTIALHGDSHLVTDITRARIQQQYTGRCLDTAQLESLLALLTHDFVARGLITTRAYLRAQGAESRSLDIDIVAGVIERYEVENTEGGGARAIWPGGVFPAKPGDLLNLRDLEQGIEQINRLRSNRARLELRPGSAPGQTVVVVRNHAARPVRLLAAYDNLGAAATGHHAIAATVTLESVLGWNEQFSLTRRQTLFPFEGPHRSEATALRAQLPYGYRTFALDVSRTGYVNTLTLPRGARLAVSGTTDTYGVGIDHVMHRDQRSRVSASARLAVQASRTWADDILLRVASRNVSYLDVGAEATLQIGRGTLNGRVGIAHGLSVFGTRRDPAGLARELPHAQFTKLTYELGYSGYLAQLLHLHPSRVPLIASARLVGQRASSSLFGSQQIVIGGPTSVRGFLNHSLSGDNGLFIRTEIGLPWRLPLARVGIVGGRIYAGIDWGRVSSVARGVPAGALSGVALGVGAAWRGIGIDAQLARAVSAPIPRMREGLIFGMRLTFDI